MRVAVMARDKSTVTKVEVVDAAAGLDISENAPFPFLSKVTFLPG